MTLQINPAWKEKREARREKRERNNADIRPWVHIGEAAELALSKIIKAKRENDSRA